MNHIKSNNELFNSTNKIIDFKKRSFFTLLPKKAKMNEIYDFESGGILPDLDSNEGYPSTYTLKPTIKNEMSEFIYKYLASNDKNIAFMDWVIGKKTNPHIYDEKVFYLLTKKTNWKL